MRLVTAGLGLLVVACSATAQVAFSPTFIPSGGAFDADFGMITGVAAADYDNDGDIDLFLPTGLGQPNRLLQNDGTGTFTDVASDVGLADTGRGRIPLFFDFNGDALLDLLVARDCHGFNCPEVETITLYQQTPEGQFIDVTPGSGLEGSKAQNQGTHAGAFAAGDLDNDGWLDLVFTTWNGVIWVYLNNQGDGTFTDISVSSHIRGGLKHYWQPVIHDFNGDGFEDIFIGMDFTADELWINQGDGTFVDVAPQAGCDIAWNGMGVTLGDIENDGDFDIYVTNISVEVTGRYSTLYVNQSTDEQLQFLESAVPLQTDASGWAWGCSFFDGDLDTDTDLAVTNGRNGGGVWATDPSRYYENTLGQTGTFTDASEDVGFDDTYVGSTVITFDVDRDGDLDLAQTCIAAPPLTALLRVLENNATEQTTGHWLTVRPRMDTTNHFAIGALVRVRTGDTWQMRKITAGISMAGQEPAEAHFGLGDATTVDEVEILWPGGAVTTLTDVTADQLIDVTPSVPCPADLDGSGAVDSTDLNAVLVAFGSNNPSGDVNGDGSVDSTDLNLLLAAFGDDCSN